MSNQPTASKVEEPKANRRRGFPKGDCRDPDNSIPLHFPNDFLTISSVAQKRSPRPHIPLVDENLPFSVRDVHVTIYHSPLEKSLFWKDRAGNFSQRIGKWGNGNTKTQNEPNDTESHKYTEFHKITNDTE